MSTITINEARITSPEFLERQLFEADLLSFIELLRGYRGDQGHSLQMVLGSALPRVLERGLGELTMNQLRELLNNGTALLELQNEVYSHGGAYWDPIMLGREEPAAEEPIDEALDFSASPLDRVTTTKLDVANTVSRRLDGPSSVMTPQTVESATQRWSRRLIIAAGIACTMLGAWISYDILKQSAGADLAAVSSQKFLAELQRSPAETLLVDAAGHFRSLSLSPAIDSRDQLLTRVALFDRTCDLFSKAEMRQLDQTRRIAVKQQCGTWLGELRSIDFATMEVSAGIRQYNELLGRIEVFMKDMAGDAPNQKVSNA